MANESKPEVAVVMGSSSDWETMKRACDILDQFGVVYHKQVISAHRTPELMAEFAHNARANGLKAIIAGAGGAAHLPGMIAAQTTLPVIGVPVLAGDVLVQNAHGIGAQDHRRLFGGETHTL